MALQTGDTRKVQITAYDDYDYGVAPYGSFDIIIPNLDTHHHPVGSVVEVTITDFDNATAFDYDEESVLWATRESNVDLTGGAEMPRRQRRVNKHHTRNKRRNADDLSEQETLWEQEQSLSTQDELQRYVKRVKDKAERKLEEAQVAEEVIIESQKHSIRDLQEMLDEQDIDMNLEYELQSRLNVSEEELENRSMNEILRHVSKF